ncbi:POZ [Glarea lozoyensis ATCC 20868]|uniref:POZ n=1 Tax=Glarea lozoyensis (strain ATCC 20868 / MF5171) TaxID=1116229 RepID=S3DHW0_GLAL2|nr:POZ [Glarea lozoyensis ATCC 20868]EPE26158.1 POZ [Glarea lozoyensis ATCC 20868]
MVTLLAGPANNHPMVFKVHKDVLLRFPFFQIALRKHGYLEAGEEKIHFVEKIPDLFHKVVQFMYEGEFYPRIMTKKEIKTEYIESKAAFLEIPMKVVRDVFNPAPEIFTAALASSVTCGAHLTTMETLVVVRELIQLMCLAHKYEIPTLSEKCLEKLRLCPFGTREVAALLEYVVTQVQDTQASANIYNFLYQQVGMHRLRLDTYPNFQELYQNAAIYSSIINLILAKGQEMAVEFIRTCVAAGLPVAQCISEVRVIDNLNKYGADDTFVSKFGSAKKGEMFIGMDSKVVVDNRGLIIVNNQRQAPGMVFPSDSFHVLQKVKPAAPGK